MFNFCNLKLCPNEIFSGHMTVKYLLSYIIIINTCLIYYNIMLKKKKYSIQFFFVNNFILLMLLCKLVVTIVDIRYTGCFFQVRPV